MASPARFWLPLAIVTIGLTALGCQRQAESPPGEVSDVTPYAELPGLQATHLAPLRNELNRLVSEQATPLQLVALNPARRQQTAPASYDGRPALRRIFTDEVRKQLQEMDRVYPNGSFDVDRLQDTIPNVLRKNDVVVDQYRQLVDKDDLAFPVDLTAGLTAQLDFVDAVRHGSRLLCLQAGEHLQHGRVDAAIESLVAAFTGIEAVSHAPHVVPRLSAASSRQEGLEVLRAISQHSQFQRSHARQLLRSIDGQLERWPADARAWEGDRAVGLHTYELVRDGHLLSLLHYDELRKLRDTVGIEKLGQLVMRNVDHDELFYLRAMRTIIEASERPFPARVKTLRKIEQDLDALQDGTRYPFIADQLLLVAVLPAQRSQALDLARMLAWRRALRIRLGDEPAAETNPLTGIRFVIDTNAERTLVDGIDPAQQEPPVVIPALVDR